MIVSGIEIFNFRPADFSYLDNLSFSQMKGPPCLSTGPPYCSTKGGFGKIIKLLDTQLRIVLSLRIVLICTDSHEILLI